MSKKVNLYLKKAKKHLEESLKLVSRASHKFDLKDTVKTKEDKEFYDVEYNHCGNIELLEASKSIIPTYDADTTYFVI